MKSERRRNRFFIIAAILLILLFIGLLFIRECTNSVSSEIAEPDTIVSEADSLERVNHEHTSIFKEENKSLTVSSSRRSMKSAEDIFLEERMKMEIAVTEAVKSAEEEKREEVIIHEISTPEELEVKVPELVKEDESDVAAEKAEEKRKDRRAVLAFKTNLLWNIALAPNIEIEFPFAKDRMSVMAEWWCPWWVTRSNSWCYQLLYGGVEARFWLGDRTKQPSLSGHFLGLYGGAGIFDLERNNIGYQSQFYYSAGITYGYSFPIHKNLRIETSLSVGYLNAPYSKYEAMEDGRYLVWQYDDVLSWWGPTKAKVSLVWTILNGK